MSTLKEASIAISNLNLWYKVRGGDTLQLVDVPSILPLRWTYFKSSWEFIKPNLIDRIADYDNPDFLDEQIRDFSKFIESQRNSNANINPFSDAVTLNRYYAIFDNIDIDSIQLTNEEIRIVRELTSKVTYYSKNDFLIIKKTLKTYRDRYTDSVGLTDADYNKAYNISAIPQQTNANIVDANYILQLQDALKSVDFIISNYFATDAAVDPFALARENANNPDINIGQYSSGRLVKLEYGEDLQSLANRQLGDSLKWIDIAIANGLKPPYIDEVGERIPLISNGSGSQINLSETDSNGDLNIDKLYINQVIELKSDLQVSADRRKIINLKQIPVSGEIIIELDGDPDLSLYQIVDLAHIRVFKPNTVNSSTYVLVPSTDPLANPRKEETPWFLANASDDEKQTKVDLAITDTGDLVFAQNGDLKFNFGIDNAVQALKFKISTEGGSLRLHPGYGLSNISGIQSSNFEEAKEKVTQSILDQIQADDRFERVESLDVELHNSGEESSHVTVNLVVRLAGGGDKTIPISFTVNI